MGRSRATFARIRLHKKETPQNENRLLRRGATPSCSVNGGREDEIAEVD